jgi:hypothetical protein
VFSLSVDHARGKWACYGGGYERCIYLIGLIVVVLAILSFFGLR